MMKLGIVVQARLGSTRLPQKIMQPVTDQLTLLEYELENLKGLGVPVIIASPDDAEHRAFHRNLKTNGIEFFLGDEVDVLKRFLDCAHAFSLTSVIRVCGDNPFLNRGFLEELIGAWSEEFDYASFFNVASLPAIRTHYGLFAEVMKVATMERINTEVKDVYAHEHVTPYFYEHPELFRIQRLSMPEPLYTGLPLRLTVDTADDLAHARAIAAGVPDTQRWPDIIAYCRETGMLRKMETIITSNAK
jgi:spore coat polysaccharide biosynthesis protein SpsF (cytidylyltransferase family)